jgi:DNA replication and repair protein RecF
LELKNIRSYESLSVEFDPGTNVLYGDNAQGKTNVLEAIYLCGTSKSYRGSRDGEIIRFGADEAHIRMKLKRDGVTRRIDMHLRKNRAKGVAIDGIPIRKAAELLGLCGMVFFSPEDLNIIKSGPRERRRFLDALICETDRYYLHQLSSYQKVLQQRNKLLKELSDNRSLEDTLDVWDEQLIRFGTSLIEGRSSMIEQLNQTSSKIHENLTGGKESIRIQYKPDIEAAEFAGALKNARERDRRFRQSTVGPHRDDFRVLSDETDLRKFGSQGQQRSAALSLKLSEISMIEKNTGKSPVLLLDDVLSELDSTRQNYLLSGIGGVQTFITCTGMDELVEHKFPIDRVFHVEKGTLQLISGQ